MDTMLYLVTLADSALLAHPHNTVMSSKLPTTVHYTQRRPINIHTYTSLSSKQETREFGINVTLLISNGFSKLEETTHIYTRSKWDLGLRHLRARTDNIYLSSAHIHIILYDTAQDSDT